MAVSNLLVAISYASWGTFPNEFPPISPNLKTVAVITGFRLITHETEECHIHWSHPQLKSFKMETEVLSETVENLNKDHKIERVQYYKI